MLWALLPEPGASTVAAPCLAEVAVRARALPWRALRARPPCAPAPRGPRGSRPQVRGGAGLAHRLADQRYGAGLDNGLEPGCGDEVQGFPACLHGHGSILTPVYPGWQAWTRAALTPINESTHEHEGLQGRRTWAPGSLPGPGRSDPAMSDVALWRRLTAEFLGSAFLAALVIGSGIAAQRLSPGATGLELLENAAAPAAGLCAIILIFGPVSGGHFNPVVSFADAAFGGLRWRDAAAYLPAQVTGCIGGAVIANLMVASAAASISAHHPATPAHFLSEVVATRGLVVG